MKRKDVIAIVIAALIGAVVVGGLIWVAIAIRSAEQAKLDEAVPPPREKVVLDKYQEGDPDAREIFELVNIEREKIGVAPLVWDDNLARSAQQKAEDMAEYNYFDHSNADGVTNGNDYVFDATGGADSYCLYASENLSEGAGKYPSSSSTLTVRGWMESEPHRLAIQDTRYSRSAVAVVYDEDKDRFKIVQHFCQTE